MGKKAVIMISLVEESAEKTNLEIEKEIMTELSQEPARIPWLKKVEKRQGFRDRGLTSSFSHFLFQNR